MSFAWDLVKLGAEKRHVIVTSRVDLDKLAIREDEQTEWKENVADVDDVVASLTAFANDLQNLGGGTIVCGVNAENEPHGLSPLLLV